MIDQPGASKHLVAWAFGKKFSGGLGLTVQKCFALIEETAKIMAFTKFSRYFFSMRPHLHHRIELNSMFFQPISSIHVFATK
jgi:hypothetical protein